ncbi:GNAT family N-acetyltransferase [Fictibacillus phosphorivorans]|uniref:GNAT family N-acetyltransferase n=1 Tax=Fictibacillus phosphorivorans TaxID=1221500 RepID=UPI00203F5410|nr:GNAT family N-acetyltransferase [Fictibacillus phosphorivorans]MCM3718047.1 GNAT family N-acetyltransferase [Fictibacillus phosphorivorans]MCM3775674.1 GNAT family N-acetyltransferase [Fictibacillus phosphorivorans]
MRVVTDLEIKKATVMESDKVIKLLKDIGQWMKDKGIQQWGYLLEGGDDEEIHQAIVDQHTYIVSAGNQMIATFTLSPEQSDWDRHIFGDDETYDSLYLHRLAVKPSYMNQGIGKSLLNWIHENHNSHKKVVKLDCVAGNAKLNQFYRDNGFEYVGETDKHSKYQKVLG